jgi:hypothetical protein
VREQNAAKGKPLAFDVRQYRYAPVELGPKARAQKDFVDMLASAIREVEQPSAHAGDPVTTFFSVPLTDIYPASGLAMGYWQNFVERTAETVTREMMAGAPLYVSVPDESTPENKALADKWRQQPTLSDEEWQALKWVYEPRTLSREDCARVTLTIWVPDSKTFVRPKYIDALKRTRDVCDAALPGPRGSRGMPVLFRPDTLQIFDIPTTLRVVATNVSSHLGLDTSRGEGQKLLGRELDRFRRSLAHWQTKSIEGDRDRDREGPRTQFLAGKVSIENLPEKYRIASSP